MTGSIVGVGVGPGDPELVTVRAARLIAEADVVAYHCARHGRSIARTTADPYVREGVVEERLTYPLTTESTDHPSGYAGALEDFYVEAAARLQAHADAGRRVVVLCEGDPAFYGSYQHLHARLPGSSMVPGVTSLSAAAAAVGRPLVQHEERLVVLPGTLPGPALRAAIESGQAAAVFKLGRTFDKVREAITEAGRLDDAWYVERASHEGQRVERLADVDADDVPYMSIALVTGGGVRTTPPPGVTVVGLGPGAPEWLTPEVERVLQEATDLVGYAPYVDRVPPRAGQRRHTSGNQVEADRAAHALDLAAAGGRVAVVSGGDPGVFAMASVVLEVAHQGGERWAGVDIEVLPGVSAAQAVAARAGAPLGHDFAVISLSDRLKPWDVILRRVTAAAQADLAMAFYNPTSSQRTWQLAEVQKALLEHRSADTPVILGRAVGRPGESLEVTTLAALDPEAVDMSTLLIIGSSETKVWARGDRTIAYTPRSYPA